MIEFLGKNGGATSVLFYGFTDVFYYNREGYANSGKRSLIYPKTQYSIKSLLPQNMFEGVRFSSSFFLISKPAKRRPCNLHFLLLNHTEYHWMYQYINTRFRTYGCIFSKLGSAEHFHRLLPQLSFVRIHYVFTLRKLGFKVHYMSMKIKSVTAKLG